MIAKICDICGQVMSDTQNDRRQETEFELHLVGVLHEGGPAVQKHIDMCYECVNKMFKYFDWDTTHIRRRLYG